MDDCSWIGPLCFHLSLFKWLYLWMQVSKWDAVKFTVFRTYYPWRWYSFLLAHFRSSILKKYFKNASTQIIHPIFKILYIYKSMNKILTWPKNQVTATLYTEYITLNMYLWSTRHPLSNCGLQIQTFVRISFSFSRGSNNYILHSILYLLTVIHSVHINLSKWEIMPYDPFFNTLFLMTRH